MNPTAFSRFKHIGLSSGNAWTDEDAVSCRPLPTPHNGGLCLIISHMRPLCKSVVLFDLPCLSDGRVVFPQDLEVDAGCNYFLDWLNSGDFVDSVEIDTALLGCSAAMDGPLICITFQGVEFGDSPLTWLEVDVRDSDNEIVLINTFDGMVMYSPAVANLPTSLGGLKAIYRN